MDKNIGYFEKLQRDILEQFKGKPNIEGLQQAIAQQLNEIQELFTDLNTLRWLKNAEGTQLDGIGDIVVMSRADALAVSKRAGQNVPMNDETYKKYLAFKMHLNTSSTTHSEVYRALKMFWNKTPLYYSENPDYPATIFFSMPTLAPEDDITPLGLMPIIKAAGVALHFIIDVESSGAEYSGVIANERITEFFIEDVEIKTDTADWDGVATAELLQDYFIGDENYLQTESTNYNASVEALVLREYIVEDTALVENTEDYNAAIEIIVLREYLIEDIPISEVAGTYNAAQEFMVLREYITEEQTLINTSNTYNASLEFMTLREYITEGQLVLEYDAGNYNAGLEFIRLREYFAENHPVVENTITFNAGSVFEKMREYIAEMQDTPDTTASYDSIATNEYVKEEHEE